MVPRESADLTVASPRTPTMSGVPSAKRRKRAKTEGEGAVFAKTSPVSAVEVISLLDSDDEGEAVVLSDGIGDDDEIEVVPVTAPVTVPLRVGDVPALDDGDNDLEAVGVIQAAAVYAHARADCRTYAFATDHTDAAHEKNQKRCDKCYCYVCDDEASKCTAWESHCMASDKRTAWRNLRTKKRSKPNLPIDVPSLLLPPKLRASASRTPVNTSATGHLVQGRVSNIFGSVFVKARAAQVQSHIDRRTELMEQATEKLKLREETLAKDRAKFSAEAIPPTGKMMTFRPRRASASSNLLPSYIRLPPKQKFLVGAIDFWRPYCSHRDASLPNDITSQAVVNGYFELAEASKNPYTSRVLARELGLDLENSSFWGAAANMHDIVTNASLSDRMQMLIPRHAEANKPVKMTVNADREQIASYVWTNLEEAVQVGLVSLKWEVVHYNGSKGTNKNNALSSYHTCLGPSALGDAKFEEVVKATCEWRKTCEARLNGVNKLNGSNCCRIRAWISLLPAAFTSSNVRVATGMADPTSPYAYHVPIDGGQPQKPAPAGEWGTAVGHSAGTLGKLLIQLQFADFTKGTLTTTPKSFLPKSFETPLLHPCFRGVYSEDKALVEKEEKLYKSPAALLPDSGGPNGQKLFSIEGILSSPLFTVSEGYAGGEAQQPKSMNVSLRPYQLQTLKWMQDQEARPSISDPFWVKLTMAPIVNSSLSSKWEPFWFCPLTGQVSRLAPPKVVGGILSEEMGLGKTIEAISLLTESVAAARARHRTGAGTAASPLTCGTTLIVTPVSLLQQWRAELNSRAKPGALNVCFWYGSNRPKSPQDMAKYDVLLTTYSTMASRHSEALEALDFFRIVIDESTYMRGGANTNMYNSLMRLRSTRRWAVSGTPFANNIKTLQPIMRFLGVSPFAQEKSFSPLLNEFNARLAAGYRSHVSVPGELPVMPTAALAYVLKSLVMRHCKRQELNGRVLVELPPSSGRMVKVVLTAQERPDYDRLEQAATQASLRFLSSEQSVNRSIIALHAQLLPVRMATSGIVRSGIDLPMPDGSTKRVYSTKPIPGAAKISKLLNEIESMRENDPVCKFVVFCENDPLKKELRQAITGKGIGVASLDGSMPATQRGRILAQMAEDPEQVVLLLSSKFAHGLNLIWANIVVFMEPSLSQETELQACDRVRRIGQTKPTTILTFVAGGTIDERICKVRTMRGHSACTGEAAPKTGDENLGHLRKFREYFNIPDGTAVPAGLPTPGLVPGDDEDEEDADMS
jgi:hypothetical protein